MQKAKAVVSKLYDMKDIQIATALLLYRTNKAVKYIQKEDPGFVFKFYHLKRLYCNYFIENGFLIKCREKDMNVLCFSIYGEVELKFHQVKPILNRLETTIDISKMDEEIRLYVDEVYIMYKLLLKLVEHLGVPELISVR